MARMSKDLEKANAVTSNTTNISEFERTKPVKTMKLLTDAIQKLEKDMKPLRGKPNEKTTVMVYNLLYTHKQTLEQIKTALLNGE